MDESIPEQEKHSHALALHRSEGLRETEVLDVFAEDVPHLLDYGHVILKRRWVVLSCLLIVFTTVAIGTLKQKPMFQGKVLLEINPESPNVLILRTWIATVKRNLESW
jgi:uncharacterized protein involved in exopolysaccharide biosynthesis